MESFTVTVKIASEHECDDGCTWLGETTYCGFPIPHCRLFAKDLTKGFEPNDINRCDMCIDIMERLND